MHRPIFIGLIVCLSFSFCVESSDSAEPVKFNVCHTLGGGMYDETIKRFAERVDALSGGRIQVNVIAAGTMGTARESAEALQLGTLEMTWLADGEVDTVVGKMGWAWLPYMFDTIEEAEQKYGKGWVRERLKAQMEAGGIVSLCAAGNMYRNLVNTKREILSLEDFAGLKVRVPEQRDLIEFYTLCGALPVAIASSEALTALEQRTIDGADSAVINL